MNKRMNNTRIFAVDWMKSVAIIFVVLCHTSQPIKNLPVFLENAFKLGQLGVQMFFVMSAYLCCKTSKLNNMQQVRQYYIKKLLRLAVPYWFAILFYQLFFSLISGFHLPVRIETNNHPLGVLINFAMLNNLFPFCSNNVVPGGWSISCIWIFFLLFPLLIRIQKNLKQSLIGLALSVLGVLVFGIFVTYVFHQFIENNYFYYFFFIAQLPCFEVGICLYHFEKQGHKKINTWLCGLLSVLSAFVTVVLFFAEQSFSVLFMPLSASVTAFFIYLFLLDCVNFKVHIIEKFSATTMSVFIFHPIFVYYGIEYTNKILQHFSVNIYPPLLLLICSIAVLLLSYITAIWLDKLFCIPVNWYKKRLQKI